MAADEAVAKAMGRGPRCLGGRCQRASASAGGFGGRRAMPAGGEWSRGRPSQAATSAKRSSSTLARGTPSGSSSPSLSSRLPSAAPASARGSCTARPAGVDPLSPEAPLAFVFSPLVGTPLTTSAKFAVVAKSPLTGLLNDALASSHFAIAGKLTGNDAIVVRGARAEPSVLLVDGDGPRIEPAGDLWGSPRREAEARLRDRLGAAWRVAADRPGRRAARPLRDGLPRRPPRRPRRARSGPRREEHQGGRGARAPARSCRSPTRPPCRGQGPARRSFGPATAKYRELGTLANLLSFNAINTLPTRNFSAASSRRRRSLAAEELARAPPGRPRDNCASCTIGCEHIYAAPGGGTARVEYENVFALGPLCGVSDPDAVLAASRSATSSASTRSRPAARSPGRWSAPSAA